MGNNRPVRYVSSGPRAATKKNNTATGTDGCLLRCRDFTKLCML